MFLHFAEVELNGSLLDFKKNFFLLFIFCLAPPVSSHLSFELSFTSVSVFILTFPHEA